MIRVSKAVSRVEVSTSTSVVEEMCMAENCSPKEGAESWLKTVSRVGMTFSDSGVRYLAVPAMARRW